MSTPHSYSICDVDCPKQEWLGPDQPFRPEVQAEHYRGTRTALRNCGTWPEAATVAEYLALADRAEREAGFATLMWGRWAMRSRRRPVGKRLELGSARLYARSQTATAIAQLRRRMLARLLDGCEGNA